MGASEGGLELEVFCFLTSQVVHLQLRNLFSNKPPPSHLHLVAREKVNVSSFCKLLFLTMYTEYIAVVCKYVVKICLRTKILA